MLCVRACYLGAIEKGIVAPRVFLANSRNPCAHQAPRVKLSNSTIWALTRMKIADRASARWPWEANPTRPFSPSS